MDYLPVRDRGLRLDTEEVELRGPIRGLRPTDKQVVEVLQPEHEEREDGFSQEPPGGRGTENDPMNQMISLKQASTQVPH